MNIITESFKRTALGGWAASQLRSWREGATEINEDEIDKLRDAFTTLLDILADKGILTADEIRAIVRSYNIIQFDVPEK